MKNRYPDKAIIKRLQKAYPEGSRVKLIEMDDLQAPPPGTMGTVQGVDDIGTVLVAWDSGSGLGVVYGIDRICKVSKGDKK